MVSSSASLETSSNSPRDLRENNTEIMLSVTLDSTPSPGSSRRSSKLLIRKIKDRSVNELTNKYTADRYDINSFGLHHATGELDRAQTVHDFQELCDLVSDLNTELTTLTEEYENIVIISSDMEEENACLRAEIKNLSDKYEEAGKEWRTRYETAMDEIDIRETLWHSKSSLKAEKSTPKSSLPRKESADNTMHTMLAENDLLRKQKGEIEDELSETRTELQQVQEQKAQLEQEILREHTRRAGREEDLQYQIETSNRSLHESKSESTRLKECLDEITRKHNELSDYLMTLLISSQEIGSGCQTYPLNLDEAASLLVKSKSKKAPPQPRAWSTSGNPSVNEHIVANEEKVDGKSVRYEIHFHVHNHSHAHNHAHTHIHHYRGAGSILLDGKKMSGKDSCGISLKGETGDEKSTFLLKERAGGLDH